MVVATVYGCLQTDLDYYETVMPKDGAFASPALFSYTLPNCFLGEAAARFGLTGPAYVVNEHENIGLMSVRAVLEDMACTGLATALAGICDLERPAPFPIRGDVTPGAAFTVLEKFPKTGAVPYGSLHLNRAREISFNGAKICNFKTLMETALKQTGR